MKSGWWRACTAEDAAWAQLHQERLVMPFGNFQQGVTKLLGRPVYTHEFADPAGLIPRGRVRPPSPWTRRAPQGCGRGGAHAGWWGGRSRRQSGGSVSHTAAGGWWPPSHRFQNGAAGCRPSQPGSTCSIWTPAAAWAHTRRTHRLGVRGGAPAVDRHVGGDPGLAGARSPGAHPAGPVHLRTCGRAGARGGATGARATASGTGHEL